MVLTFWNFNYFPLFFDQLWWGLLYLLRVLLKKALYLSVHIPSTEILIENTDDVLRGQSSHTKVWPFAGQRPALLLKTVKCMLYLGNVLLRYIYFMILKEYGRYISASNNFFVNFIFSLKWFPHLFSQFIECFKCNFLQLLPSAIKVSKRTHYESKIFVGFDVFQFINAVSEQLVV